MTSPTPEHRGFRYTIRGLLLLVTIIAVPLAWKVNRVRNQRLAVAEIERTHGWVVFDCEVEAYHSGGNPEALHALPRGPKFLGNLLGSDFFSCVVEAAIGQEVEDPVKLLALLPDLERLTLHSDSLTDDQLLGLTKLTRLQDVHLAIPNVSRDGLNAFLMLMPRLQQLQEVGLDTDALTDDGLELLAMNPGLRTLSLRSHQITDTGFRHLARLKNLGCLTLFSSKVTVAGLRNTDFERFVHMRWFQISD